MPKITKKEIQNRIQKKFGKDYIIIGDTNGMESDATFKHLKCGREWKQYPQNFLKGIGCIECNKQSQYNKLSFKEFEARISDKYGDQYTLLDYKSLREPFRVRHNFFYTTTGSKVICNHEDVLTDGLNFLKRHGRRTFCKYCKGHQIFKNVDIEFKNSVKFCVYIHLNVDNQKKYIGITSQLFQDRWNKGNGYFGNNYFYNAIKKYGWDKFKHYAYLSEKWQEVFEEEDTKSSYSLSLKEALDMEEKLIDICRKKYGKENIYNISAGGEGITGVNDKAVLQFTSSGDFLNKYTSAKNASIETNISYGSITQCCTHKSKSAGGYLWKYLDDVTELLIPNNIVKKNIEILQYDINGDYIATYPSIKSASEKLGISKSQISLSCKNEEMLAGGFQWKKANSDKKIIQINKINYYKRQVYQYDLSGNYIATYDSISKAEKESCSSAIWNSCNNLQAQSGGYIWLYDKNDLFLHLDMIRNKRNVNQLNVYKYDLQGNLLEKYNSVKSCAKANNVDRNTISRCCNEQTVVCNGYIYLHEDSDYEEKLKRKINIINNGYYDNLNNRKKVAKCDINTKEIIKIYNSVRKAAHDNNIKSSSGIIACCKGRVKTASGYIWKYIDN